MLRGKIRREATLNKGHPLAIGLCRVRCLSMKGRISSGYLTYSAQLTANGGSIYGNCKAIMTAAAAEDKRTAGEGPKEGI